MKILVVEDDASVAAGVQHGLHADGHDVEVTHDGAEALCRQREGRFDLIVLDILLPSLNGYRVCRTLREDDDWTPILMLTAKCGEYDEAEGLEVGADDFLAKPFSMVVLQARVRALLRRPRHRHEWPEIAGLRLEPHRGRCVRGAHVIPLSARELEMLAYFFDHAGEIVDKHTLRDAIWGGDFAGDPNVVEVYVGRLRRKLDDPNEPQPIETIRGVGYRLRAERA